MRDGSSLRDHVMTDSFGGVVCVMLGLEARAARREGVELSGDSGSRLFGPGVGRGKEDEDESILQNALQALAAAGCAPLSIDDLGKGLQARPICRVMKM